MPKTSSPSENPSAREASTVPDASLPRTAGSAFSAWPRRDFQSIGLTEAARTRIRTPPSSGLGASMSSSRKTSGSPVSRTTTALMVMATPPLLANSERFPEARHVLRRQAALRIQGQAEPDPGRRTDRHAPALGDPLDEVEAEPATGFDRLMRVEHQTVPGVDHFGADVLADDEFDAHPAGPDSVYDAVRDQLADQEPQIGDGPVIGTGRGRLTREPPGLGGGALIHRKGLAHDWLHRRLQGCAARGGEATSGRKTPGRATLHWSPQHRQRSAIPCRHQTAFRADKAPRSALPARTTCRRRAPRCPMPA